MRELSKKKEERERHGQCVNTYIKGQVSYIESALPAFSDEGFLMTDGWFKPKEKRVRKMHYFKDGRSLCESYYDFEAEGQEDDWHTEEHCVVCEEELRKLRKREMKEKNRCSHIDVKSGIGGRCNKEVYANGLCRKHWLTTSQEFYGGFEMTGAEKENLDESE